MYTATVTRKRKLILALAAAVVISIIAAAIAIHDPGIQRRVWEAVTAAVEESSDVGIEAAHVRLRFFPARLVLREVTVSLEGETVLAVEEIRADWQWRRLAAQPRRIETVTVQGPVFFGDALPAPGAKTDTPSEIDIWGLLEIGSLRISGGRATAGVPDVRVALDDVSMQAQLIGASAAAAVEAGRMRLDRSGRELTFGPLSLNVDASADGVVVQSLEIGGDAVSLSAAGGLGVSPRMTGRFETQIEADLASVAGWWDPNLVTGLAPDGRARLVGDLELLSDGSVAVALEHRGAPMSLAGYDLDTLELFFSGMGPSVRVAGAGWGRAEVTIDGAGVIAVSADLDEAPVDRVLAFTVPRFADAVLGPTTVSGRFDGTFSFPIDIAAATGDIDLVVLWSDGRMAVRGAGVGSEWQISRMEARLAGVTVTAHGSTSADGTLRAEAEVGVADPAIVAAHLRSGFPGVEVPELGGGPIEGTLRAEGTVDAPGLAVDATWVRPTIAGRELQSISVNGRGGLEELQWTAEVEVDDDSAIEAHGTAHPLESSVEGDWKFAVADLARLAEILTPGADVTVKGRLEGAGSLAWSQGDYRMDGRVEGLDVGTDLLAVPRLRTEFTVDSDVVSIESLEAEIFGGVVEGRAQAPLTDLDAHIDGQLSWRGLDLAALSIEMPESLTGRVSGQALISGSVSRPQAEVAVQWEADGPYPVADRLQLQIDLANGVVRALIEDAATRAGTLEARAELPLGDIERPPWLWADAPAGPMTGHLEMDGFRFGPIAEMLAVDILGTEIVADLRADFEWNPLTPDHPKVTASAHGLRVTHPTGELVADGPIEVTVDGRTVEVAPVAFVGFDSRIEVEVSYDPSTDSVQARLAASVSEALSRLLPMPVRMRGPLSLTADLKLPASADASLESVTGTFALDHGDGAMVMRDPPVEIKGLKMSAALEDGRIDILDGQAEVNRGTVTMGGGWDPVSGQGVVFEMENVTLFFEGILTRWDGDLAVEPKKDSMAHVTGDLTLMAGLWDETIGLASAVFGAEDVELAADDPLYDISLDLSVRGRSGIRVDNNLGHFDVNWDVLRIDGSAAVPRLRGEVRIAPGGVIALGGREVKVRRGSLDFTGDPTVDPIVEIVPESDMTLVGGEDGTASLDPTLMATRGLAQGLSSALGFENETLRPAEIATQTERDPSVNFMVGQRISRNLALFLTTNLTDVQDRSAMIQGWNFRGIRGLVLQVYQETVDDNFGGNILQRFTWGGPARDLGRPEVYRLRLEGDWPMSKGRLKKATRLRRGQPFEPFLLFVAGVRMERALAENGYQNARVTGFQEGDERSPTLVFYCEPGTPQFVRFEGEPPSRQVQAEITSLYEPPPLENGSLRAMTALLTRSAGMEGYPDAEVTATRQDDVIVISIDKGNKVDVQGPFFDGLPPDIAREIEPQLGSANVIATMAGHPERFERTILQRLASLGYFEAEVLSFDVVRLDEGLAEIRISVDAGSRQAIDEVVFVGSDPLNLVNRENFEVKTGQPLDRKSLDLAARDVRDAYIEAGYRDARARSEVRQDENGRWVVDFDLEPGALRRLRNVEYSGVKHASKKILAKGLSIDDGEVVTDAAVDQSANRIANFSPIERVEVWTRDVGFSEVDVEFAVVEKPRWAAEVGGGWSTERGLSASFGIRDDDLFGRGIGLNLRGGWGSTEQKLFLIGSLPPVPGGRLSLISTVGYLGGDAPDEPDVLDQEEFLASLEAQYTLANRIQVGVYYRWTDTRTFEKEPDPFNPFPVDVRVKLGTIGARTIIDRFDNLFDPRRGYGLTSDIGWSADVVGSDFNYVSWLTNFTVALEPFSGATWLQTAHIGVAEPLKGENLIPEARFFAGGQASVRGFDLNSVGPVTFGLGGTLVPEGGGALFILNEELRIPVWGALRAAVFADIGQVWPSWRDADLELSVGAGVGVRWSTPIGPLWFDIAWPVANVGISSKKTKFYLGIGRPF